MLYRFTIVFLIGWTCWNLVSSRIIGFHSNILLSWNYACFLQGILIGLENLDKLVNIIRTANDTRMANESLQHGMFSFLLLMKSIFLLIWYSMIKCLSFKLKMEFSTMMCSGVSGYMCIIMMNFEDSFLQG